MPKPNVLIQIDTDEQASSFDALVAIDSAVDHLLRHSQVRIEQVEPLVHGAMFTRGGDDLRHTALFFGGSDVKKAESLFQRARQCFFGDVRVSMMSDPNGSNTTAAAAVLSAERHLKLANRTAVVLGGTGPVGLRIAQLIGEAGGRVLLGSRRIGKSSQACEFVNGELQELGIAASIEPVEVSTPERAAELAAQCDVLFAAGAAGVSLLDSGWETGERQPKVVVDINAVPPAGIAGVGLTDRGVPVGNALAYGAIGVGNLKMKIHKRCIQALFKSNDQTLETRAIYAIGKSIIGANASGP